VTNISGNVEHVDRLLAVRSPERAIELAAELLLASSRAQGVVAYVMGATGRLDEQWSAGQLDGGEEDRRKVATEVFRKGEVVVNETICAVPLVAGRVCAVLVAQGGTDISRDLAALLSALGSRGLEAAALRASSTRHQQGKIALTRMLSPALVRCLGRADFEENSLPSSRTVSLAYMAIEGLAEEFDIVGPERLLPVAHQYYQILVDTCYEHDGFLLGHGLSHATCVFGAPLASDDMSAADLAVATGVLLLERLHEMKDKWGVQGLPVHLAARIGVATGQGVVGTFGPADRPVFSVLGPLVTLAEKLAFQGEVGEVIVDSTTRTLLSERVATRSIGAVEVRGLDYPIFSYSVQKILLDLASLAGL
jgi:hypothetical protein